MRSFFISDIHGQYYPMMKLLEYSKFDPINDKIVFGGDLIDRGPDSGLVLKEVRTLQLNNKKQIKVICGNHEEMLLWHLLHRKNMMWLKYGGLIAIDSFNKVFPTNEELNEYVNWISKLPLYVEDNDYLYIHAGIEPSLDLTEQTRKILWMEFEHFHHYAKSELLESSNNKKIIHGHTAHQNIIYDGVRMCCDLGAGALEPYALALVDLSNHIYYKYSMENGLITVNNIILRN